MVKDPLKLNFNLKKEIGLSNIYGNKPKEKRVNLTAKERLYVWEHPTKYGRKCNVCGGRIIKMSDMELDHTTPYSKGGTKMNLAHRDCNRMKGSKSLKHVQTKMGFTKKKATKTKPISKKSKKKTTRPLNPFGTLKIKQPKIKWGI